MMEKKAAATNVAEVLAPSFTVFGLRCTTVTRRYAPSRAYKYGDRLLLPGEVKTSHTLKPVKSELA